MIAHIFGKVVEKFNSSVIVDVGGVGYEVQVAGGDFEKINIDENIKLHTYHHVREQSQELFGFSSLMSKKLFELLITVQGIGPKAALAILSLGSPEIIRNSIAMQDDAFIAKASGVGKKIANRIVIDLFDKVGAPIALQSGKETTFSVVQDDALDALMSLGFSLNDATNALREVSGDLSTSDRIKHALRNKT